MRSTLLVIVAALALVGGAYYYWQQHSGAPLTAPPVAQIVQAAPSPLSPPAYPVSQDTNAPPAANSGAVVHAASPTNNSASSDDSIENAVVGLFGQSQVSALFHIDNLVRRIVVTVDNLTKPRQPSEEFLPLKPMGTDFRVAGNPPNQTIDPLNSRRYQAYVELLSALDAQKAVGVYEHFYPQFQSAYQEIGAKGYFNDRLIEVINSLLATPDGSELKDPIQIARPTPHHYKYKFVDNQLEGLPSGQKILIRMGRGNTEVIKAKLRLIRTLLTHLKKK